MTPSTVSSSPAAPSASSEPSAFGADESPQARGLRPSTVVWGMFTLAFGVLLLAIAAGVRFSVFSLIIIALGGLGLAALLLAVLPRPKPQVEIAHNSDAPEADYRDDFTEIFDPAPPTEPLEATTEVLDLPEGATSERAD